MAKLAFVRFGSEGQGPKSKNGEEKKYTYVVNDNVRTGDRISPVVKHAGEKGTIFVTTGKVMATATNTERGKGKEMAEQLGDKEATNVYSGKELGLGAQRGAGGKFTTDGGGSYSTKANGYIVGEREKATRGGNIQEYVMQHGQKDKLSENAKKAVETFESYSSAFLPTGQNWRG